MDAGALARGSLAAPVHPTIRQQSLDLEVGALPRRSRGRRELRRSGLGAVPGHPTSSESTGVERGAPLQSAA